MKRITLGEFRERSAEFAGAVALTPGISKFCTGPLWQLAAHDYLHAIPEDSPHLIVEESGTWLAFVERDRRGVFFPFESAWLFGSPLAGEPQKSAALLQAAAKRWMNSPCGFFVGGLSPRSPLHEILRQHPGAREIPTTDCMIIDLSDGCDAWLERRSKKFRRSLHAATEADGIEIVDAGESGPDDLYLRLLQIQRNTYKWLEGTDIFQYPDYAAFYRAILGGLHEQGDLRLLFAQRDGTDVGYILGGIEGETYRGLQMSYCEEVRSLGVGNRLQWENLRRCAAEGITRYDLGMPSDYKKRWADIHDVKVGVFLVL